MTRRNLEVKRRGKIRKKTKPVYLIIAEGRNRTENLYFHNFRKQEYDFSLQIAKAGSKTDAESLYETMIAKWEELDLSSSKGDLGFVVIDIDNDSQKADKVLELIHKNHNPSIQFIVSNPTFEVWLLMHYRYTTKQFADGNAVIKELKKYIPDYEKNQDYFPVTCDRLQYAIVNSEKLEKHFEDEIWPSIRCNPRTDVGSLVCILCRCIIER